MARATMLAVLAMAFFAAMSVQTTVASDLPLSVSDDALLYNDEAADGHIASALMQRSLLATGTTSPPYYCANSHIRPLFIVKHAVLIVGTKRYGLTTSADYVRLVKPRLDKRFKRYNRRYRLDLGYTITQLSRGGVKLGQQKWFYFEFKFIVGTCGLYKFPLVTQLRGEIQPSAAFIKRNRVLYYPYRV